MLTLHAIPDFASTIIHLALVEIAAPFAIVWEDEARDVRVTPGFLRISPFGLIPALETPEGPVFETAAILMWLADRHPGLAPPPGDPRRGAFLSWFAFTTNTLHPLAMQVVHPERAAGVEASAAAGRAAALRLREVLPVLDAALSVEPEIAWPALAFYVAVLLRWVQAFPADPADALDLSQLPALSALLAATETRAAARAVAAEEGLGSTPFTRPQG
ncbi:MAG: glutathione S-transferase family protein [Paracoccaceae bacterium]|nr:MAG: glutathione S-transferase family protein [Paracoccaceae bacterium]